MIAYKTSKHAKVLFVGINPHPGSYRRGVPFSNNKMFWYLLNRSGLLAEAESDLKETVADVAVRIDDAVLRHRIVNWTTNSDVQNRMRNDIEDALFDLKCRHGLDLSFDEIDAILEKCLDIARRRYPG